MASLPSTSLPSTMRAWHRPSRGPAATSLQLAPDLPVPSVPAQDSDELLIRVTHVALEYAQGLFLRVLPSIPFTKPPVPELEFSGIVLASGSNAPPEVRAKGTRVTGFQTPVKLILLGQGVLAEYLRISGTQVVRIPDALSGDDGLRDGAGIFAPGATALKMVRTAGLKEGNPQRILVNGASGAVGHLAVQLARDRGMHVVAVASGKNEKLVRGLGANEFVDYTAASLPEYLASTYGANQFDYIFDCVGSQQLYLKSPAYLKPSGAVINIGGMLDGMAVTLFNWLLNMTRPVFLGGTPRNYVMFSTIPTREDGVLLLRMVEEGRLKIFIDSSWAMNDVKQAYALVESKRARGKVIINVGSSEE